MLLWLFVLPLICSGILFLCGFLSQKILKATAFLFSLIPLVMLLSANWNDTAFVYNWFPMASVQFYLRIDALSLLFLYLVAVIIPICIVAEKRRPALHLLYGFILLLQALLIGFFTARDLVLFTIFWEAMLFPLYFIIANWGGRKAHETAFTFLLYMITGSALLIAAVLGTYFLGSHSFSLDQLSHAVPAWIGIIFTLAFAVKTPLFPFHGWLPDTYCQAPVSGTILLSALLSKAGIYGFLRIAWGIFPDHMIAWSPLLIGLSVVGVFYGGLTAWRQLDYKRLIAYSSLSHVNFILAGVFIWNHATHSGAIVQSINHGITIAALFLAAEWLERRVNTTDMRSISGVAATLPQLCWLTLFFVMSSIALPGTNSFVGELMILFGVFGSNPWLATVLGLTVILSVIYMLRWMQKVYFELPSAQSHSWKDLSLKEFAIAIPFIVLILWIGLYPQPISEQALTAIKGVGNAL